MESLCIVSNWKEYWCKWDETTMSTQLSDENRQIPQERLYITGWHQSQRHIFIKGFATEQFSAVVVNCESNASCVFFLPCSEDKIPFEFIGIFKFTVHAPNSIKFILPEGETILNFPPAQAEYLSVAAFLRPETLWDTLEFLGRFTPDWHSTMLQTDPKMIAMLKPEKIGDKEEIDLIAQMQDTRSHYFSKGWQGAIDGFDSVFVSGWAKKTDSGLPQEIDLYLNGKPLITNLEADKFRPDILAAGIGTGKYSFKVQLPSESYDSNIMAFSLRDRITGKAFACRFFRYDWDAIQCELHLDSLPPRLCGWCRDVNRPERPLWIRVFIDDVYFDTLQNNQKRPDLKKHGKTAGSGGFVLDIPEGCLTNGEHRLELELYGGRHSVTAEFNNCCSSTTSVPDMAALQKKLAVIIPFNGEKSIESCIESLLSHSCCPINIILLEIQKTEADIPEIYWNNPKLSIIRNPGGLNIPTMLNLGIKEAGDADVVILNPEINIGPKWLVNLRLSAASSQKVATAAPLSNLPGILASFMTAEKSALCQTDWSAYSQAVRRTSVGTSIDIPFAYGDCLYITGKAIACLGQFAENNCNTLEEAEADFCLRALWAGWHNVLDVKTWLNKTTCSISHYNRSLLGSSSFREKWPEAESALKALSKHKSIPYLEFALRTAKTKLQSLSLPRILWVIATTTGGTPQTNMDLMKEFQDNAQCYLLVALPNLMQLYELRNSQNVLLFEHKLKETTGQLSHVNQEYNEIIGGWIRYLDIDVVHIRSLIWHSLDLIPIAKSYGCKVILSFHDFYTLSPNLNLVDDAGNFLGNDYTEQPSLYRMDVWGHYDAFRPPAHSSQYIKRWRERFQDYALQCDAYVTTSDSTRSIILNKFPMLQQEKLRIIPHGRDFRELHGLKAPYIPGEEIRILALGNMNFVKGEGFMESLIEYDEKMDGILRFHVLGIHKRPSRKIVSHGEYVREELSEKIAAIRPHAAIIFSVWSETWCHTLTELWAMGIPVFVFDIGTQAERVGKSGAGWVIKMGDIPEIYSELVSIIKDPEKQGKADLAVVKWQQTDGVAQSAKFMSLGYYDLYSSLLGENCDLPAKSSRPIVALNAPADSNAHIQLIDRCSNDFRRNVTYLSVSPMQALAVLTKGEIGGFIFHGTSLSKSILKDCVKAASDKGIPYIYDLPLASLNAVSSRRVSENMASGQFGMETLLAHAKAITTVEPETQTELGQQKSNIRITNLKLAAAAWPGVQIRRKADSKVRALFYGTSAELDDLRVILPALATVNSSYPCFCVRALINGAWNADEFKDYEFLELECFDNEYNKQIKSLTEAAKYSDFGIAPQFSIRGASMIKLLELGALGLPCIASSSLNEPFFHIPHLATCINDIDAWREAVIVKVSLGSQNRHHGLETQKYIQQHFFVHAKDNAEFDSATLNVIYGNDHR